MLIGHNHVHVAVLIHVQQADTIVLAICRSQRVPSQKMGG